MIRIFLVILVLFLIDQIIKRLILNNIYNSSTTIIKGMLNLTYVENTGGAFGVGKNNIVMINISNFIVIAILIVYILKNKVNIKTLTGISLMIAGGMGNLVDRIFRGYVIDYIDINPLIKYPVFNIADIYIVIRLHNYFNKFIYK